MYAKAILVLNEKVAVDGESSAPCQTAERIHGSVILNVPKSYTTSLYDCYPTDFEPKQIFEAYDI